MVQIFRSAFLFVSVLQFSCARDQELMQSKDSELLCKGKECLPNPKKSTSVHVSHSRIDELKNIGFLPFAMNSDIEKWMDYYQNDAKRTFNEWLSEGENIKPIVQPAFKAEGMPPELLYIAMVESGFSTKARSYAHALGAWQFVKSTAVLYGLTVNHWVDDRLDPVKSTQAAARYLKQLYCKYGDWYLAIAAYNAGPGKLTRAMNRAKTNDFWELAKTSHISRETKDFVPKILASIILASNAEAYGFTVPEKSTYNAFPTSTYTVRKPWKLKDLAKKFSVSLATLKKWNPSLIRGSIPPVDFTERGSGYELRVPEHLFAKIKNLDSEYIASAHPPGKKGALHVIKKGETLSKIAKNHKMTVKEILALNPKLSAINLKIGKRIALSDDFSEDDR